MSLGVTGWLTVVASDRATLPVLALGALGALGIGIALWRAVVLGPALIALAGAYAALLAIDEPPLDARAAGVAAALLAIGELVGWARELAATTRDEPGNAWRRPVWIAGAGIGAVGLVTVLLAVVDLVRVEGLVVEGVGALAALAAVTLALLLARAQAEPPG